MQQIDQEVNDCSLIIKQIEGLQVIKQKREAEGKSKYKQLKMSIVTSTDPKTESKKGSKWDWLRNF
jgi:hypothetical protein